MTGAKRNGGYGGMKEVRPTSWSINNGGYYCSYCHCYCTIIVMDHIPLGLNDNKAMPKYLQALGHLQVYSAMAGIK